MKYVLLLLLFSVTRLAAQTGNDSVFNEIKIISFPLTAFPNGVPKSFPIVSRATPRPRLFLFLTPDCPICRGYSPEVNRIVALYQHSVDVFGIIPGKTYSPGEIDSFATKFKVGYQLLQDKTLALSRYLQASVTPEVILLDSRNQLVYKGAIDDGATALGKSGGRVTRHYLSDALAAVQESVPVTQKRTRAVGCILNDY